MATGYYLLDNKNPNYPQYGYPRRYGAKATGTIILHDAEGGTDLVGEDMGAEAVANYIRTRTSAGSYHRLCDRDSRIRMLPIDYEAWHSIPDNPWSVGICVAWNKADLARMTYAERRSYYVPLAQEVLDVRAEFARRGIAVPIDRWLTAAETQARKPGISTHSRTDPSRRSDPFGTGSTYEREFLEVLAAEAGNHKEGFLMGLSDDKQDKAYEKILEAAGGIDRLEQIFAMSTKNESMVSVIRRIDENTRRNDARYAALAAAMDSMAKLVGIDPAELRASIDKAVAASLARIERDIHETVSNLSVTLSAEPKD